MFSAVWAIANQAAGGGPIGQAAPVLYELPFSAITDVDVPLLATFTERDGRDFQSAEFSDFRNASYLAQPLDDTTKFYKRAVPKQQFDSLGCVYVRDGFIFDDWAGVG